MLSVTVRQGAGGKLIDQRLGNAKRQVQGRVFYAAFTSVQATPQKASAMYRGAFKQFVKKQVGRVLITDTRQLFHTFMIIIYLLFN